MVCLVQRQQALGGRHPARYDCFSWGWDVRRLEQTKDIEREMGPGHCGVPQVIVSIINDLHRLRCVNTK